jgi:low affinity Fe/Cu permease
MATNDNRLADNGTEDQGVTTLFRHGFRRFAQIASLYMGSSVAFALAVGLVVGWAIAGPFYKYSDSWELIINTTTTIITFLMVFLIQNTQNRDGMAIQLKLDELLRALEGARNSLVDLENLSDEEMKKLQHEFARLSRDECAPAQHVAAEDNHDARANLAQTK